MCFFDYFAISLHQVPHRVDNLFTSSVYRVIP